MHFLTLLIAASRVDTAESACCILSLTLGLVPNPQAVGCFLQSAFFQNTCSWSKPDEAEACDYGL